MTDTPDKEWIERADTFVENRWVGKKAHVKQDVAYELQCTFDQGVEAGVKRERKRLHGVLDELVDLAEGAMRAANNDGGEYDIDDALAEARDILTPSPTEGERG